jgi:hypothetical protein
MMLPPALIGTRTLWKKFVGAFLGLILVATAQAQSIEEYRTLYPDQKAIYTKQTREYYFEKKGTELSLSSKTVLDLLFLYDDANAYSEQSVYQSSFSAISNLEAQTVVDGKEYKVKNFVTKTNESRNVFFDDSKVISFSLLNIGAGTKATITYNTNYPNPVLLPDVYFTSYIVVHDVDAIFYVDKDIDFRFFEFNLKEYGITYTKTEKRGKYIYKWNAQKVKPIHPDNYSFNSASKDLYMPHVITYIASYEDKGKVVNLQTNVDDLYKWNYSNLSSGIGTTIDLTTPMKAIVDSIKTASKGNEEDCLKGIYSYVQKKIYYVAIEDSLGGFIPRKPSLVLDRKYGDCKDMACLLHAMLGYAGFKSYPTWIGTRDIMYDVDKVPLLSCFNHMITAVDFKGTTYFLDPTMNWLPYYTPAYSIQGKQGLLSVNDKEYKLLRVSTAAANTNSITDSSVIDIQDSKVTGSFVQNRSGYPALMSRYTITSITQKDFQKAMGSLMERGGSRCIISAVSVDNKDDVYRDLKIRGQFEIPNYVSSNGDNVYLNLNLENYLTGSVYPVEHLIAPTGNNYLYEYTYVVRLKIPKGMKAKYVPENFTFTDKHFECSLTYTSKADEIILVQRFVNKELYWYKDYFPTWNSFQKKLMKGYKESIVLTKL